MNGTQSDMAQAPAWAQERIAELLELCRKQKQRIADLEALLVCRPDEIRGCTDPSNNLDMVIPERDYVATKGPLHNRCLFRLLMQATPCSIGILNSQGRMVYANKSWSQFFGLPEDTCGSAIQDQSYVYSKVLFDRELLQKDNAHITEEMRLVGKCGHREWFDVTRAPFTLHNGDRMLLCVAINITCRVEAVQALETVRRTLEERVADRTAALGRVNERLEREVAERKMHERLIARHRKHLEALMNALADGALLMDTSGKMITLNTTAAHRLGVPEDGMEHRVLFDFLEETPTPGVWRDALYEVLETMAPTHFEARAFGLELDVTYYPVLDSGEMVTEVAVYMMDMTASKQFARRLRRLSAQVLSAQEEERRRIGRELHDSTAQTLSGIKFMMEGERNRMEQSGIGWPTDQLAKIIGHLQSVIVEIRRIIMALRPTVLDDIGLLAALRWLQQEIGEMHSLAITSHLSIAEELLSEEQKPVLFRVAQEALYNVVRHSSSRSARLSLEQVGDQCEMTITDNGTGFDILDRRGGIGLDSMRERLEQVSGRLEVVSEPGIGTVVRAVVPLDAASWESDILI